MFFWLNDRNTCSIVTGLRVGRNDNPVTNDNHFKNNHENLNIYIQKLHFCNTSFSINRRKLTLVLTLSGNFKSCARISETACQN